MGGPQRTDSATSWSAATWHERQEPLRALLDHPFPIFETPVKKKTGEQHMELIDSLQKEAVEAAPKARR
eukprot:535211-Prorocentrum_lima.AAC.1